MNVGDAGKTLLSMKRLVLEMDGAELGGTVNVEDAGNCLLLEETATCGDCVGDVVGMVVLVKMSLPVGTAVVSFVGADDGWERTDVDSSCEMDVEGQLPHV